MNLFICSCQCQKSIIVENRVKILIGTNKYLPRPNHPPRLPSGFLVTLNNTVIFSLSTLTTSTSVLQPPHWPLSICTGTWFACSYPIFYFVFFSISFFFCNTRGHPNGWRADHLVSCSSFLISSFSESKITGRRPCCILPPNPVLYAPRSSH